MKMEKTIDWMKQNFFVLIICLISILICTIVLYNISAERAKCIEQYEEYITTQCTCQDRLTPGGGWLEIPTTSNNQT